MLSARQLYERGVDALEHGRLTAADRSLQRALARTDEIQLRARIHVSLAYQRAERGRLADGLSQLAAAERDGVSDELRGLISGQRGLLLMRSGDVPAALRAFTSALGHLQGDPATIARVALNRGDAFLLLRDLDRARADFERCIAVAQQQHLGILAAKARHNVGYVELLAGNLPDALREMQVARSELQGTAPAVLAVCDYDRSQALVAAGLTSDADRALAEAIAVLSRQRLRQSQAEAELTRAELLHVTGRPDQAVRLAHRAAARFRSRGATTWALRAESLALGAQATSGKVPADAVARAGQLESALAGAGLREEARTARLRTLRAAHALGDSATIDRLLPTVRVPRSAPVTSRLLARIVRADVARDRGRPAVARQHLRTGLNELFAWQSSFGSLDLQTGVAGHGRALARRGLGLAIEDGRPQVVFEWSERARAFASRLPAVRPPADPVGAAALAQLRQLRAETELAPDEDSQRRMRELEREVRDRALYSPGPGIVTEPLDLGDLRTRLAPYGGTLVSHLSVEGVLHALVVTSRRASVRRLGPHGPVATMLDRVSNDLDVAATRLAAPIRTAVTGSLAAGLDPLARTLWQPLAGDIDEGPVVLVPSAVLTAVPWSLLPGLTDRVLTVARTATAWALQRTPGTPVRSVGLVAGPRVDRAEAEVRLAAEAWPDARTLTGAAANAAAVSELAASVDLVHVAAHGTHSTDNPLFSGLELADGPWFGHDIAAVDPVPGHVVLSACELGRATVRAGEETLGMTAAWQHAGARTVLASAVRVNDEVACELLATHHAALAAGDGPAEALARSRAALPADAPPAPFVCFGAGW